MEFFINSKKLTTERFDMSKFMEYTDNYDPLTSRFLNRLLELPVRGQTLVEGEESRPDQLAAKIFGDSQYWWVVLFYNKKQNSDNLVAGEVINFPSLQELEELLFSLKAKAY